MGLVDLAELGEVGVEVVVEVEEEEEVVVNNRTLHMMAHRN
jgi:hypothetical protein